MTPTQHNHTADVVAIASVAGLTVTGLDDLWAKLRQHSFATPISLAMVLTGAYRDLDRLQATARDCRKPRPVGRLCSFLVGVAAVALFSYAALAQTPTYVETSPPAGILVVPWPPGPNLAADLHFATLMVCTTKDLCAEPKDTLVTDCRKMFVMGPTRTAADWDGMVSGRFFHTLGEPSVHAPATAVDVGMMRAAGCDQGGAQ